jgi:membrane protease YdiL (CAAX protease family)
VAFRGYFQRQFAALAQSRWIGLLMQALVFGFAHSYEGVDACMRITIYALVFGLLAFWRKSLRPGMIGHAFSDIVAGLFGV